MVKCEPKDVAFIVVEFSHLIRRGRYVHCEPCTNFSYCIMIVGIGKEISETKILEELNGVTHMKMKNVHPIKKKSSRISFPSCL